VRAPVVVQGGPKHHGSKKEVAEEEVREEVGEESQQEVAKEVGEEKVGHEEGDKEDEEEDGASRSISHHWPGGVRTANVQPGRDV
jgi:hypothetical protein